ncbi:hypothetical protein A2311_00260 [candidate division WOR-1 bacterium RIFOXYB2_FULL_48_7]|uniref:Translation initiation factor IF-2 n=1 Tax=candidate division WOR-1 bacterium RIFOXYB2_FULL_48_7 TaxID=1802583 RepID=A0A1F4TX23_UNCSA|nr:MAG: hypothetical protein A2311_00260 [candidate division WOR-1 bacterium RIFOXYB2_FULL_48_7]
MNVSAKTGQGIDDLLEMILLLAEMEELTYNPAAPASGVVIESNLDARKGVTATLLVKEGALKTKDAIATESTFGPVKNIKTWQGENLSEAAASTPIEVIGLVGVPFVGETWQVEKNIEEAEKKSARKKEIEEPKRKHLEVVNLEEGQKILNIILKADAIGTLEAIRQSLEAIGQEKVVLRIIEESTGEISDHDIQLASSAGAPIFSFRVKLKSALQDLVEREGVKIKSFEIIYELIQSVREGMGELLDPEILKNKLGEMEILAIFKIDGRKKIIGGRVRDGLIQRGAKVDIFRDGEYIGDGRITQLQHDKKDIAEVGKGKECGLLVESDQEIKIGDTLENYKEEKRKQTL